MRACFGAVIFADACITVYIAPDGALSYTVPHSAHTPEGSVLTGWSRMISDAHGGPVVLGNDRRPAMACRKEEGVYQIYVKYLEDMPDCVGLEVRTYGAGGIVAWEY